jgi:hypothetical protein
MKRWETGDLANLVDTDMAIPAEKEEPQNPRCP